MTRSSPIHPARLSRSRPGARGMSLIEMMVALGIGSIVLVVIGLLSMYGLRSFLVMGNCAALDDQNRLVADRVSRDLRDASKVLEYQADADGARLLVTNNAEGITVEYLWSADTRTLICRKTDEPQSTLLTECDAWQAAFFQNLPQPSVTHPFTPATNAMGATDYTLARVVNVSWTCSRPLAGGSLKTDAAQALRVVLRNLNQP